MGDSDLVVKDLRPIGGKVDWLEVDVDVPITIKKSKSTSIKLLIDSKLDVGSHAAILRVDHNDKSQNEISTIVVTAKVIDETKKTDQKDKQDEKTLEESVDQPRDVRKKKRKEKRNTIFSCFLFLFIHFEYINCHFD